MLQMRLSGRRYDKRYARPGGQYLKAHAACIAATVPWQLFWHTYSGMLDNMRLLVNISISSEVTHTYTEGLDV